MTESELANTTVWLTRPRGVVSDLTQRFERLGARVLYAPVLEVRALPEDHPAVHVATARVQQLHQYQHIIFISGNAVNHGMPLLRQHWPASIRCYAIGKTTARILAQYGIQALQSVGPQMNSEALLALPQLQTLQHEKVLIVRGLGGRETLARTLMARGADVDYLEAYQRFKSGTLPQEISRNIAAGSIDFVLAASGETVATIVELVDSGLQRVLMDIAIVVPGARVAALARQAGFKRVIAAVNAGDDAMLGAVMEATEQQG
jgi:uroporphyrinogen-III synthase